MHAVSRLMGLLGLSLAILPALVLLSVASVYADSSDGVCDRQALSLRKDMTFRVTDQLSAQTQAAILPRRDVAFSLTQRLWARSPGEEGEAARQELASLRLSQQIGPSGQRGHAFSRLAPSPLWADLLLEAQAAPLSTLHFSATAAYDPAEAHLARATAGLTLQPLTFWTLSLAPDFGDGSRLEHLTCGMQLTLPGAWTVSYAMRSYALDATVASHTVTTLYRSSYGDVRLQLVQSPEQMRVEILVDFATFLRRTLGFS